MKSFLAIFFRSLFKIKFFSKKYFFFHKHFFGRHQIFKGLEKEILYRNNIKIHLDLNDWIQQQIYFLGDYEKNEIDFLYQYLKEGDTFVDIGGNIGLFSLNASKILEKSGEIFSFEAFLPNYNIFGENIKFNNFNNIHLENLAISDEIGKLEIFYDDNENNVGMASAYLKDFNKKLSVDCTTLDEFVKENKILEIKLIKIDIEGGEYKALIGMQNVLKNLKPTLIMEVNDIALKNANQSEAIIIELLAKIGYSKIKELSRNQNSYNAIFKFNA
ncbi:FkbM family methyltransferase [Frigoriflavimonas asaccharolytica]|uniref:FkbM family methyltransferase n=1 Tax=Frigoriflavimonas asaccharolytica TaxID=2735899 RepID=A0A8J8G851_9FLAO|nr:FkbM family methyltransferase [Frigoriflavimonas asaccharolytica]NRS91015.1 FkbM family methyltransferase [Frigoriflavimonas asaccharolytica]